MLPDHSHTLKSRFKRDTYLVGEELDKELPGIVGARGDTVWDRGYCYGRGV